MNTYVKIKDGKTTVSCNVFEWPLVVERITADECPEGFKLRVKANEKPDVPQGKWLAFRFDDVGDSITKTYFLVNEGESAIEKTVKYSVPDLFFWLRTYDFEHKDAPKGQLTKDWLDQNDLYTISVTTREVNEDNELFKTTLEELRKAVGFTTDDIDAALEYARI